MVNYQSSNLDAVFHALADPTRRAMLASLAEQPHTVSELARPFAMSLAAASKHVKVLEKAGLLRRTIQGRTHVCRLDPAPIRSGAEWMRRYEKFWGDRLDSLEAQILAADRASSKTKNQSDTDEHKSTFPRDDD